MWAKLSLNVYYIIKQYVDLFYFCFSWILGVIFPTSDLNYTDKWLNIMGFSRKCILIIEMFHDPEQNLILSCFNIQIQKTLKMLRCSICSCLMQVNWKTKHFSTKQQQTFSQRDLHECMSFYISTGAYL